MSDQPASENENPQPEKPSIWQGWAAKRYREWLQQNGAKKAHRDPTEHAAVSTARATWAIAILTIVTVGIGVSHYYAFHGQLDAMQGQLREMQSTSKQTDKTIAAFEQLARATQEMSETAKRTIDQSRDANEKLIRAYIHLDPDESVVLHNAQIVANFRIENTGVTPAYNIRFRRTGGIVEGYDNLERTLKTFKTSLETGAERKTVVPPNGASAMGIYVPVTPAGRAILRGTDPGVWACAIIDYSDIFGKERTTENCGAFIAKEIGKLLPSQAGKDATATVDWKITHGYAD